MQGNCCALHNCLDSYVNQSLNSYGCGKMMQSEKANTFHQYLQAVMFACIKVSCILIAQLVTGFIWEL